MSGGRRKPCLACEGRRWRLVNGELVTCKTCEGTGAAEVPLRLFEPVMETLIESSSDQHERKEQ